MTTQEVANRYYALSTQNKNMEIIAELYGDHIECIEPAHAEMPGAKGKQNITERMQAWFGNIVQVHDTAVSQPQVMGNHFSVGMMIDITTKDGHRNRFEEIGVYQVEDGKIVREQYFY